MRPIFVTERTEVEPEDTEPLGRLGALSLSKRQFVFLRDLSVPLCPLCPNKKCTPRDNISGDSETEDEQEGTVWGG